jgi:hypothetical protein
MMGHRSKRATIGSSGPDRRALGAAVVAIAAGATLASCQLPGTSYVVTTTADGADAAPGDGVCETVTGNGSAPCERR